MTETLIRSATRSAVRLYTGAPDPDGNPNRFLIDAPVGLQIVGVLAQGAAPIVVALVPVGAPEARHGFWLAPPDMVIEPLIGRTLGKVWPLMFATPQGQQMVFIIEDLPWPQPRSRLAGLDS